MQTLQEYFKSSWKRNPSASASGQEILFGGPEKFDYCRDFFCKQFFNLLVKVRTPLTEIVVGVDDRNSRSRGAFLELWQCIGCGDSIPQESLGPRKVKVIDNFHEHERVTLAARWLNIFLLSA